MTQWTQLVGDINHERTMDTYDVILLATAYGSYEGDPRWKPDANLNTHPDPVAGKQVIGTLDAIILANNFKHASQARAANPTKGNLILN